MKTVEYDPDQVDWLKTFDANPRPPGASIKGPQRIIILRDGTRIDTDPNADKRASEMSESDEPTPRRGRPSNAARATTAVAVKLPEALPAGGSDPKEEKPEKPEKTEKPEKSEKLETDPDMTKPRAPQNLPGTTATAGPVVVREIPVDQIHEAIEQNFFENGVEIRVAYKNNRGVASSLMRTTVPLEALVTDLEEWLRSQFGGGCFRIDARDPLTGKRALPIPVFEVNIHAPPRIASNGTILAPGQSASGFAGQGSPMSFPQSPWSPATGGFAGPLIPGPVQVPQGQPQPQPWISAGMPAFGAPVMSMPPDAIAMTELQKAQTALSQERSARARDHAEFSKKFELLQSQINEQRLKEQDRERQHYENEMRDQMRRMEENFRGMLERERSSRPAFDLTALAGLISAAVPLFTAMMSTRSEQATKAMDMQQTGLNNLLKATIERGDSKWLEKLVGALPVVLPAVAPVFKLWAEQKSPAAQADLVATLSENNLTALSMMAKFMNEMVGSGPDQPAWVPVFHQMVQTVVTGIDSLVKSNKSAVGIPVQSAHFPAPPPRAMPAMTPAQMAMGGQVPQAAHVPAVATIGAQVAHGLSLEPAVPSDFKTPPFLKLIEDLHNQVDVDQVAQFLANHLRELEDNVPALLKDIWTTDEPEKLLQSVFVNLPIWNWNQPYVTLFIEKTVNILVTPPEAPPVVTSVPAQQPGVSMAAFFKPVAAAPA